MLKLNFKKNSVKTNLKKHVAHKTKTENKTYKKQKFT